MTTTYQSGIVAEASSDALFITLNVNRSEISTLRSALAATPKLIEALQQQFPDAELHAVLGLSSLIWDELDKQRPQYLAPFPHILGKETEIKPTDVDLVLHIRSSRHDASYQLAHTLFAALGKSVTLVEEVRCFKYLDNRDLTGFVDGTENPAGEKRKTVALVGDEDPDFKNGSYFNLMRFVHDLEKWQKEDLKTQEDVFGRTKHSNQEYPAAEKSVHAHTKRTSLKDENGQSMEILRHSMPFASLSEKGLMFASYSKTPVIFNLMLESMIKGDEHGNTDHLMKYTRATTGQAFFAPSNQWLMSL
ncbi:Dyp-type peroxidase [Marinomonas sp. M1K-6]|uniref:Dyp-type peroxidase n=1 Tax=Marinomonas profundi TaxID=2726122 RepID=A0A847R461_9GAMM|nr:Dyp-type peroxidase [Marinomonas profundi]NLQ16786.1 Dyp-type peroxidase [Marinomonas profundi]UDV02520.1 Dyp-type peroxidase [Marinomonas profundi]